MNWPPPGSEPTTIEEPDTLRTWFRRYWWTLLIVAVIVLVAALPNRDSAPPLSEQRYIAHAACADFTRDRLRAPSTADFPEHDDRGVTVVHRVDGEWTVRSFVDSENGFGAKIRTAFVCTVSRNDNGDWRLIDWAED